jgi:endonuclease/exonuclease/phosphatase family metal-dependent hydrolase
VIKKLKKITVQMLVGANMATIALMLLTGYSDRLHPVSHPLLSTIGMTFPVFVVGNIIFLVIFLLFKWTRAWIPVLGFALAFQPIRTYMPIHMTAEVPEGAIKVISYNVCGYGGNFKYEEGLETVRDYLMNEKPDIVCVQEDNDTWRHCVFREYEKFLAYNDTLQLCNSTTTFNCLGIHTRFPIIQREVIPYDTEANNGSAAWWLKVEDDTLIVINNHFESCHLNKKDRSQYKQMLKGEMDRDSLRAESKLLLVKLAEANAKRSRQIERVCEYIKEHEHYSMIVCGDFNDNPISYSIHTMSQLLTDSYVATGRGVGLSYNQKGFFFRIDHLFCSSDIQPFNCKIDDKMDASDHYPLICWLKIDRKQ